LGIDRSQGGRLVKSPRARAALRRGLLPALLMTASLVAVASAQDVIQRSISNLPSFFGYVPDELVVVFKQETAHQLTALPPQADRARANLERVQQMLDRVA